MNAGNNDNKKITAESERLFDAVTDIRSDIITGAENSKRPGTARKKLYIRIIAAAAALSVIITGAIVLKPVKKPSDTMDTFTPSDTTGTFTPAVSKYAVAEAQYPKMALYPDETQYIGADGIFDDKGFSEVYDAWNEDIKAQRRPYGYADGLEDYFNSSAETFLSGNSGENKVYSPLNIYMALSMLAETADGESRRQILDLLGCGDIDSLRKQASDVWNATYRQDGAVYSVLANSLWTDKDLSYKQDTIDRIAGNYYASVFSGEMGSEDYSSALRAWLSEQTGGLLEQQAEQVEMSPETVLAIASTVYFRCKWKPEYNPNNTQQGVFHGTSGDTTAEYMNMMDTGLYYWDEGFGAVCHMLENRGFMWFILPDEGITPEHLLENGGAAKITELVKCGGKETDNCKRLMIDRYIPKFDVSGQLRLEEGLRKMGVADVFDPDTADFSPLSEDPEGLYLSSADHACRVSIDEDGVTAAAYTVMMDAGAAMPPDEKMEFRADRPFIFVITNPDNVPMFIGIVNEP